MANYFLDTPIYTIWVSVIGVIAPKSSFIVSELNYCFVDIVCNREGVTTSFCKNNIILKLKYAHEYRRFVCNLEDQASNTPQAWAMPTPVPKDELKQFRDFENEVDKWMNFLRQELK